MKKPPISWVLDKGTCSGLVYSTLWQWAIFNRQEPWTPCSLAPNCCCPCLQFLDFSLEITLRNAKLLRSSCDGTSKKGYQIKNPTLAVTSPHCQFWFQWKPQLKPKCNSFYKIHTETRMLLWKQTPLSSPKHEASCFRERRKEMVIWPKT